MRYQDSAAPCPVPSVESHPLYAQAGRAFNDRGEWDPYWQAFELEFNEPGAGSFTRGWFRNSHIEEESQLASRWRRPALESTAPLGSEIRRFRSTLRDRAGRLRNEARTNALLALMVAASPLGASERAWTERLLLHLHDRASRPKTVQRLLTSRMF